MLASAEEKELLEIDAKQELTFLLSLARENLLVSREIKHDPELICFDW